MKLHAYLHQKFLITCSVQENGLVPIRDEMWQLVLYGSLAKTQPGY